MPEFDVFTLPVHPVAEQFPMMPEDELKALAADIAANGLKHPILVGRVQSGQWTLDDGRNRREGCRIAGVQPTIEYQEYQCEAEQVRRIWSENGQRRNMTKGVRAMVAACIFPEPEKGGRGKKALTIKEIGVNAGSLSQARTVIRYAPELVDDVKAERRSLMDAYTIAKDRRQAKNLAEESLQRLRDMAPDLADRVADGTDKLTLVAAQAMLDDCRKSTSVQAVVANDENGDVVAGVVRETPELPCQIAACNDHEVRQAVEETITKQEPQPAAQSSPVWAMVAREFIRQLSRQVIDRTREIGEELAEVKAKSSDASFSEWLQALGWSDEDARRFMEILDRLDDEDADDLGVIDLSVLNVAASFGVNQPAKAADASAPIALAAE